MSVAEGSSGGGFGGGVSVRPDEVVASASSMASLRQDLAGAGERVRGLAGLRQAPLGESFTVVRQAWGEALRILAEDVALTAEKVERSAAEYAVREEQVQDAFVRMSRPDRTGGPR